MIANMQYQLQKNPNIEKSELDRMKSEILLHIIPFLEKFDGLSGSVISCMIDIGNAYTVFKDNDPCPSLQKMLYDIIFETGDVPEYVLK